MDYRRVNPLVKPDGFPLSRIQDCLHGGVRPCVDYRRVNQLVKPDGFPLSRIQDCLDAVAGSSLFSTFDLLSGFFPIPVKESDIPKTAFVCKYGHYEMTRMPFGLNNAA